MEQQVYCSVCVEVASSELLYCDSDPDKENASYLNEFIFFQV